MKKSYGIVLGSGLSLFSEQLEERKILYDNPKGIHHKKIFKGYIKGHKVIIFEGRNHIYENVSKDNLFFNIEFAKKQNVDSLILTNASGGLNPKFNVSDLMLITSFVNFQFKYLKTINTFYKNQSTLFNSIIDLCTKNHLILHKGTYCSSTGPVYETRAEMNYLRNYVKADAVGMSTVPEIMYASRYGIKTIPISCITNLLAADIIVKVNHSEVIEAGKKAYNNFSKILNLIIENNL